MFCHHCGKELKESDIYCPYCGTKVVYPSSKSIQEYNSDHKSFFNAVPMDDYIGSSRHRTNKNKGNKWKKVVIYLIVFASILVLALCTKDITASFFDKDRETVATQSKAQNTYISQEESRENTILQIMEVLEENTYVMSGIPTSVTYLDAISRVFVPHQYEMNSTNNNDGTYHVVIAGKYYPNFDVPQLIYEGELSLKVDVENHSCIIDSYSDVETAIQVYAVSRW